MLNKETIDKLKEIYAEIGQDVDFFHFFDLYKDITEAQREATRSMEHWHAIRIKALEIAHDRLLPLFKTDKDITIVKVLGEAKEIADQYAQYIQTGQMNILNEDLHIDELINWLRMLPETVTVDAVLRSITYNHAGHNRTQAAYLLGLATVQIGGEMFNKAEVIHQLEQLDDEEVSE